MAARSYGDTGLSVTNLAERVGGPNNLAPLDAATPMQATAPPVVLGRTQSANTR